MENEVVVSRYTSNDLYELRDMIKASFSTRELQKIVVDGNIDVVYMEKEL